MGTREIFLLLVEETISHMNLWAALFQFALLTLQGQECGNRIANITLSKDGTIYLMKCSC